jgi:glycosyltransferase involved in cell wall biosynthesis
MSSFYSLPIARLHGIPLINGSIRNCFARRGARWLLERILLRASDYRVANSHAGLRSRGLSARDSGNVVIYNGFDFARLERRGNNGAEPVGMCNRNAIRTVGMVAEFNRFKDHATFIEMARQMSVKRRDVAFVLVGDGEALEASQKAAADVGAIRFLGRQKNIEAIVGTFEVGVLCTFGEGLSNSVMEYMALGRPVVATDGGGTRELVVDGETGFLVPPADPWALAERIDYLLANPAIAMQMGKAGEARLRRDFAISRMIDETIRLYTDARSHSSRRVVGNGWRQGGAGA